MLSKYEKELMLCSETVSNNDTTEQEKGTRSSCILGKNEVFLLLWTLWWLIPSEHLCASSCVLRREYYKDGHVPTPKELIFWKDVYMNGYITRRTDKCGIGAANAMRQKWKRERESGICTWGRRQMPPPHRVKRLQIHETSRQYRTIKGGDWALPRPHILPEVRRLLWPHITRKGSLQAKGELCQGMSYPDVFQ